MSQRAAPNWSVTAVQSVRPPRVVKVTGTPSSPAGAPAIRTVVLRFLTPKSSPFSFAGPAVAAVATAGRTSSGAAQSWGSGA